ncbi:hypothetical protein [Actinoplanes sp. NPDC026670]|uniref:hypothetical protein n=1 Tax=Actinoplanes sp. NPDC026670 TaxID=3154700 RepID=UPI0033C95740
MDPAEHPLVREQLTRLATAAPHITVQVVLFEAAAGRALPPAESAGLIRRAAAELR